MADTTLTEQLQTAIRSYAEGNTTLDDLRRAALIHLRGDDDIEVFFRLIPADAAAEMVRWLEVARLDTNGFVQLGNFSSPAPVPSPARTAMIGYVRGASKWLSTLNVAAAASNVNADSFGDWYRDPWGWPELNFLASEGRVHVLTRALKGPTGAAVAFDVPKSPSKTRPAVVLELVDRVLYQASVDSIAPRVDERLSDWVFGWRTSGSAHYSGNQRQWRKYFGRLRDASTKCGIGWHTDIANFFASVPGAALDTALKDVASPVTAEAIATDVRVAMDSAGRNGIPQRSTASSVLANLLLVPVDDVANATGTTPARWLDDVWVFSDSDQELLRASDEIKAKIRELGFDVNEEKTSFYEGQALSEAIDRLNFSYIDSQLENTPKTPTLTNALEFLIANHETAARHEINFVTSRIKRYHREDLALQLAEHRSLFMHAADLIVPVLLKFGIWRDLIDWSLKLLGSDALPWIKSWVLRMYPRSESWSRMLRTGFAEASASEEQDTLVRIIALSRLPKSSPRLARELFDSHERLNLDPMLRRGMAVMACTVGVQPKRIRRFLLADDRTIPFADFITSIGYQRGLLRVRA